MLKSFYFFVLLFPIVLTPYTFRMAGSMTKFLWAHFPDLNSIHLDLEGERDHCAIMWTFMVVTEILRKCSTYIDKHRRTEKTHLNKEEREG